MSRLAGFEYSVLIRTEMVLFPLLVVVVVVGGGGLVLTGASPPLFFGFFVSSPIIPAERLVGRARAQERERENITVNEMSG